MSTAQQPVWHLTGQVITGPEEVRSEAWVVDGRLTFEAPPAAMPTERVAGALFHRPEILADDDRLGVLATT